jgi:hypothetical protein
MSETMEFASEFVQFMNEGCSAFHAVEACQKRLAAEGFKKISEKNAWSLEKGGKYYFTRNETSLMAFTVGEQFTTEAGCFTAVGAHTDSPCLRIKAISSFKKGKFLVLNTQPYGGGLWHTWFDRDLGLGKWSQCSTALCVVVSSGLLCTSSEFCFSNLKGCFSSSEGCLASSESCLASSECCLAISECCLAISESSLLVFLRAA